MITILAVVTSNSLINALLWVLAAAIIYWILTWGVARIAPPEPFKKIIEVILVILICIMLINAVLSMLGRGFIVW